MRRSLVLLLVCMLAATAVLIALGFWQVRRLYWKEALIGEIEARRAMAPAALGEIERQWGQTGDVDYRPITLSGVFRHQDEQYFYTTDKGNVGWQVLTPMTLENGRVAFVNRGFVPDALRDPALREPGQAAGVQTVAGLARNPAFAKPNRFVPDNEPGKRTYFWKNLGEMAIAARIEPGILVPFFIDAGTGDVPGGWPKGGSTIVDLPNSHRGYAIIWFGLAAACLGVGLAFLFSTTRNRRRAA